MADRPFKVVPISSKSDNSASWSPKQCVQSFNDDVQAGKITPAKIMILWFHEQEDGGLKPNRWFANMTRAEEVALVEIAKQIAIDEWRK